MTTKPKVFEVGDKVTWNVNEECPYRCEGCGLTLHTHTHALTGMGMVMKTAGTGITIHQKRGGTGCGQTSPSKGHDIFVAFLNDRQDVGATGGRFTADELQLIEGE